MVICLSAKFVQNLSKIQARSLITKLMCMVPLFHVMCNYASPNKDTLKRHIQAKHKHVELSKCLLCDFSCIAPLLQQHMLKQHTDLPTVFDSVAFSKVTIGTTLHVT
eukprot:Lithocolla_globosa_v1_NODE_3687_length_1606_cov_7.174726.p2 type:complete len:107 gc:universal NODE_3687_length_1606_cov_7.174726:152-472(+)